MDTARARPPSAPPAHTAPPLYRQLAERLALAIRQGALRPGSRLPSLRQAAREHQVSVATVVQAYHALEDARLVRANARSGHVVLSPPRALPEPDTSAPPHAPLAVDISSLTDRVMAAMDEPGMVSFGAACPQAELFDVERLRRAMAQATLRQRALLGRYPQVPGELAARQAIAQRALAWGCTLNPADIQLTNSCTESVALALRAVTRPGDTVALESPTCHSFLQMLEALHLKALEIPTHPRHGLSVDALALALRTHPVRAVLAVPTLQNPLGASMPQTERRRLAELLARHQVPLIEDAIFNDLAERDEHRRTVKSFDREGWVMLCSSYSKTLAPGLRIGWIEAGRFATTVRRHASVMGGGHTPVVQAALARLLTQPGYEPHLRRLRQALAARVDEARGLIAAHFPPGTRVTDPPGGIMLWVELPPQADGLALFSACLAEGICIAPGTMFSATGGYRHCVRLSFGSGWGEAQRQALQRVGALAQRLGATAALPDAPPPGGAVSPVTA